MPKSKLNTLPIRDRRFQHYTHQRMMMHWIKWDNAVMISCVWFVTFAPLLKSYREYYGKNKKQPFIWIWEVVFTHHF